MPSGFMKNIQAALRYFVDTNIFYSFQDVDTGPQLSIRKHLTIAQINAGVTILPAIPGFKYRILDMWMIAVGGAASGATDVRILGTRAAASVALLVAAVAGLTQSTILRAGVANAAVLADGASFSSLDVNTAVTVGKTGGALATSTFVDVIVEYAVEKV